MRNTLIDHSIMNKLQSKSKHCYKRQQSIKRKCLEEPPKRRKVSGQTGKEMRFWDRSSNSSVEILKEYITKNQFRGVNDRQVTRKNHSRSKSKRKYKTRTNPSPKRKYKTRTNPSPKRKYKTRTNPSPKKGIKETKKDKVIYKKKQVTKRQKCDDKLKTYFESVSFRGSNESFLDHLPESQSEFGVDLYNSKTTDEEIKILDRSRIIDPPIPLSEEVRHKYQALSGKTFVRTDDKGELTEFSFKPVMVMHVKKTPMSTSIVEKESGRGITKSTAQIEGYNFLNEISANEKQVTKRQRCDDKLKTYFESVSFRGSNESFPDHLPEFQSEFGVDLYNSKTTDEEFKILDGSRIIDPPIPLSEEVRHKYQALSGKTFVRTDDKGELTEFSFKPVMLMRIKKTPMSTSIVEKESGRGITKSTAQIEGYNFLNEISAGGSKFKLCDSKSDLNSRNLNNQARSRELLRVKSSRNFMDLSYERQMSHSSQNLGIQELLPPTHFRNLSSPVISMSSKNFKNPEHKNRFSTPDEQVQPTKVLRRCSTSLISQHCSDLSSGDQCHRGSSVSCQPLQNVLPFTRSVISHLHGRPSRLKWKESDKYILSLENSKPLTVKASVYRQN